MKKNFFKIIFLALLISPNIKAATVSCDFLSGEAYSISSGAWIGTAGYEDIWDLSVATAVEIQETVHRVILVILRR